MLVAIVLLVATAATAQGRSVCQRAAPPLPWLSLVDTRSP